MLRQPIEVTRFTIRKLVKKLFSKYHISFFLLTSVDHFQCYFQAKSLKAKSCEPYNHLTSMPLSSPFKPKSDNQWWGRKVSALLSKPKVKSFLDGPLRFEVSVLLRQMMEKPSWWYLKVGLILLQEKVNENQWTWHVCSRFQRLTALNICLLHSLYITLCRCAYSFSLSTKEHLHFGVSLNAPYTSSLGLNKARFPMQDSIGLFSWFLVGVHQISILSLLTEIVCIYVICSYNIRRAPHP